MGELLGLSWDNYRDSMTGNLKTIIRDEDFVDVSLHCEGRTLRAHKVYLSACSDYFRNVLKGTNLWQHPILFLTEVPFVDLQKILEFVYCGEIQLPQKRLGSFLKSAEILKINGLVDQLRNNHYNHEQTVDTNSSKRKKRRKESTEAVNNSDGQEKVGNNWWKQVEISTEDAVKSEVSDTTDAAETSEQVVVKADPDDFQTNEEDASNPGDEEAVEDESVAHRGIVVRNDLLNTDTAIFQGTMEQAPMYGERGRCHFCQLLCPDRASLTAHLKASHQPPKHSLCENCENFFHICAITRHREKCRARYHTDKKILLTHNTKSSQV